MYARGLHLLASSEAQEPTYAPTPTNKFATKEEEVERCIVCWDPRPPWWKSPVRTWTDLAAEWVPVCLSSCACRPAIHAHCLRAWAEQHHSCPICRARLRQTPTQMAIRLHALRQVVVQSFVLLSVFLWIHRHPASPGMGAPSLGRPLGA